MNDRSKRVAAIHDLSGFGRCSLSVIMPTLSAMGIQVCPVPTAILSSHTGGLGEVAFRDLSDFILPCLEHYQRLHLDFECIYSGFLGSEEQISHCLSFIHAYPKALAVVDPVMGDHGKPYRTYTKSMCNQIRELVREADVITPNLTEACILLDLPYLDQGLSTDDAKRLLSQLGDLGPQYTVITGVPTSTGQISNLGYDKKAHTFWITACDYVPVSYPGTGDIFASVLTGALLSGDSLPIAMGKATCFTEECIKTTFRHSTDPRYGVMLEKVLAMPEHHFDIKPYSIL